jgi:hypothetical protein
LLKLARLANFIEDLPHSKFHMPAWSSKDGTDHECGTAGCFGGWGATVYASEGWSFGDDVGMGCGRKPTWNGLYGCVAIDAFFGLGDAYLASRLTSGWDWYFHEFGVQPSGITPQISALAIRKVLNSIDPSIVTEAERAMPPAPAPAQTREQPARAGGGR